MAGDDNKGGSSGGFDDWLDEEPGPDTDPYAELDSDDPEEEISDWMAFTQGEPSTPAPDFDDGDETGEIEVVAPATTVDAFEFDGGGHPDTEEVPIVAAADVVSASVTNDTPEALDDAETPGSLDDPDAVVEMEAVDVEDAPTDPVATDAAADADAVDDDATDDEPSDDEPSDDASSDDESSDDASSDDASSDDEPSDDASSEEHTGEIPVIGTGDGSAEDELGEEDDTGELEVIEFPAAAAGAAAASSSFGDLWDQDADEDDSADPPADDQAAESAGGGSSFDMTQEDYLQTATKEHQGLAAAIADADDEDTEQVALAAPIPGLESTVVGFDDVVEAEGHSKVRARRGGDLVARVITAIVLIIALVASLLWQPALLALATVVFVIAAGEFYTALARTGRHPIGLFGFIGIVGATVGAFVWGAIAIPISFVLITTVLLLYYAVVPGKRDPMANLALTVTVMVWVGLGAYAMLIAVSDEYRPLVLGVVVTVAAMDIAQYFVGRSLGRHPLAPWISPKKTIEGLVGGIVVALAIGASLHFFPPFELTSGLALGVAVAVLGPLGDLAVSAAKRSLDLKDMGSILPGHGGFLDRIDALLFVIPAAWAIFLWAGIL
ncbi:MAG: phosphatidate cytidylyltransferase [Acidimicrobiia bacterium]